MRFLAYPFIIKELNSGENAVVAFRKGYEYLKTK